MNLACFLKVFNIAVELFLPRGLMALGNWVDLAIYKARAACPGEFGDLVALQWRLKISTK